MKYLETRGALALAVAVLVTACGGSSNNSVQQPQPQALRAQANVQGASGLAAPLPASAYYDAVQQIYIAYFGRPADPGGLTSFAARLAAIGAPTDLAGLNAAYLTDAALRQLIDGFGGSEESAALYASGDTNSFVTAVYYHLLNRAPDADGLAYWANSINSNLLSKSRASLSIATGALGNTTEQGKKDAALIGVKTAVASAFTTAMQSNDAYAGNTAASLARNMLDGLAATSKLADYQPVLSAVVADMQAGKSATHPYPLLLSYIGFLSRGSTQAYTISASCTGSSTESNSAPVAATFLGKAAFVSDISGSRYLADCNPSSTTTSYKQYFDANFTPLGADWGTGGFAVFTSAPAMLPVHVATGDSGSYGVQTFYADSTRKIITGRDELSYVIEGETKPRLPLSAIFKLTTRSYNASNTLVSITDARYRISVDGTVSPLTNDMTYIGSSGLRLYSIMQPTELKIIDTVVGTGATAAVGKTATVNYALRLYDAEQPNSEGMYVEGSSFSFKLGSGVVIAGFEQGMAGMKVGGKRRLIIPASLAYKNTGGALPPGSGLIFDVELVSLN